MINYSDEIELNEARLNSVRLNSAELSKAELSKAELSKAELSKAEVNRSVQQCPRSELLARISEVEEAVARGTAQMRDYETFVCCKEELMRREVLHSNPNRASKR